MDNNVILLGDYNLNYLNMTEKSKLDIFASKSGLEIVNLRVATRCTDKTITFIDHCFISNDQIIAYNVKTRPFTSDHFLVIFGSNLSLKSEIDNIITIRNIDFFHVLNLTENLPSPNGGEFSNVRTATIGSIHSPIFLRELLKNTHEFKLLKKGGKVLKILSP